MADSRTLDVLVAGGAAVDLVLTLDRIPGYDEKVLANLVGHLPGGPGTNFACAAGRLKLRVASLSSVGDDEEGRLVVEDLARFGVDTSLVEAVEGARTNFTVVMADPTGEKAIVVVPMLPDAYRVEPATRVLRTARLLYLMPSDQDEFLSLARLAHGCGAEVMVDVESTVVGDRASLERVLREVDIASFNQGGFLAATGEEPTPASARKLLDLGPHTVVVTRGALGSLAVTHNEFAECPGHAVHTVDTTGAGDTFNAAFVWGMLREMPLHDRLRFANAAAAISVTVIGPRGRLPSTEEVEEFLRANGTGR